MQIWIVTTCIPGETSPCYPEVFATEVEAHDWLESTMQDEWEAGNVEDDDGNPLPYPGDWQSAQQALIEWHNTDNMDGEFWGEWLLSSHDVAEAA